MKKTKKILALAMAAAMALAPTTVSAAMSTTTATASPATGESVSDGDFEGWIEKEVFKVTLPTSQANAFDFIIDPQNLIVDSLASGKGNSSHGTVVTEGAVGVYFTNNGGYAVSSDALTVSHQSSMELNVSVEASLDITSGDAVKLVTAGAVTNDIATSSSALDLCISVNQVTTGAVEYISDDTNKATLNATMAALDADNFEVQYNSGDSKYEYVLKSSVTDKEVAEFYLTGSCNTAADWSAVKDMSAELSLVWNVSKGGAAAEITEIVGSSITNSGNATTYSTSSDLASRLATGAVVFRLSSSDVSTINNLSVSKITVDGTQYSFTTGVASSTVNSDGKTYTLTGFSASTAKQIEVYYGNSIKVTYSLK